MTLELSEMLLMLLAAETDDEDQDQDSDSDWDLFRHELDDFYEIYL